MAEAVQSFDLLKGLQTLVADRLSADTQISGPPHIAVIADDGGDIDNQIQKRIGAVGSGGGVVIVGLPAPNGQEARTVPDLMTVEFEVNCIESPIINRSQAGNKVQDNRLAEIVLGKLNNYQPETDGWSALQRTGWSQGMNDQNQLVTTITFATTTMVEWEDVPEE
jgi:hypothetical protein